jgi:hypothetical protein
MQPFADQTEQYPVATPEAGTPQGGVISPLLANIYLHYVLDVWFLSPQRISLYFTRPLWYWTRMVLSPPLQT